ncbi:hypothetical protein F5Y02DRAFT_133963 [Annulohypoxylon stygium]|nr:hypothetical protein F5Y02DRAFT_133963 [Annulohypoxylon stygium]
MTMAAAVQAMHSSASSSHQQAPSTALVLEFVCLFTRDLRRKQKRWQDGRLKYHTYNKRIMVYDDHGNFVGDTHWREDYDLNDGDEVELERGGVIVQVAECTGSRDQDLSELVDKRAQEKAERRAAALARRPSALESTATTQAGTPHFQLRHKPLHHLIGTPTGHHGRALIPTESPYEERQKMAKSPQDNTAPPAKRRKREVSPPSKGGYAKSLFGAALTLSGTPTSSPIVRSRPSKASPDPGYCDEDVDSTLVPTRRPTTAPTVHKERPILAPRTTLLSKISKPGAVVQGMNNTQSSSLPMGDSTGSNEQRTCTNVNKRLGPKQKGEARGHVIEDDSLQPISINLNTTDRGPDKLVPARSHSKQDVFDSVPSVTSSKSMSEPRTELRIRPRKKRGLLMVSENLETRSSTTLEPGNEDAVIADASRSPKRREQPSRQKGNLVEGNIDPSMEERDNEKQAMSDEDCLLPGSVAAPRLAHLGRKSIRSREVIGFIFDEEETKDQRRLPQSGGGGKCDKGSLNSNLSANHSGLQATASAASLTDLATTKDNRIDAINQCSKYPPAKERGVIEKHTIFRSIDRQNTGTADVETTSKSLIQPNAPSDVQTPVLGNTTAVSHPPSRMVVNPATRGKKAAKPSDAAGQVPQCPLPSEVTGDPSISKRHENDRRRPRLENRTKETHLAPMPGFARANGGPWSREAHDLFEFTRPP